MTINSHQCETQVLRYCELQGWPHSPGHFNPLLGESWGSQAFNVPAKAVAQNYSFLHSKEPEYKDHSKPLSLRPAWQHSKTPLPPPNKSILCQILTGRLTTAFGHPIYSYVLEVKCRHPMLCYHLTGIESNVKMALY